jgi:hypothetical protein
VLVWCKSCRHQADADLQRLVDAGRGDVSLIHLRYRCRCGSRLTDWGGHVALRRPPGMEPGRQRVTA